MSSKRLAAQQQVKTPEQAQALLRDAVLARDQAAWRVDVRAVEARLAGVTWEVIGVTIGLTKQGAHQRYAGDHGA